ncbi:MAG TPA: hypothetical protein VN680_11215 [Burkholderiaceae bacterium]|jgi:hypothetical protein|nr:hypothetical protein [Burkholderiaceae bacterium]
MNQSRILGVAALAGLLGFGLISRQRRDRVGSYFTRRMHRHMENMMASLPADSPPKLVMSLLPRVRDQNDQIIEMVREQNALLREYLQR